MADFAHRAWGAIRAWPLWAQALAWLLAFWALIPLLIWRSAMGVRWKVVLSGAWAVLLIAALAGTETQTPSGEPLLAEETPQTETRATPAPTPSPRQEPVPEKPAETETQEVPPRGPEVRVTRVIDGDTIEVSLRGAPSRCRL